MTLFVGTDVVMFSVETYTARDAAVPNWNFFYSPEPTTIATDIDELRAIGAEGGQTLQL